MRQINVSLGQRSYPILIGPGLLGRAAERLSALPVKRWAVVADETAASLYAGSLGLPVYAFPAGEGSKCLAVYESLCRRMLADGFTRADGIVALGGGVAGDLAGFLAGTILRGVPLVQMPTTLLAQVDSSVGGKTGLDLPEGKNLIGCFYQPSLVLADTDCLGTLPRRQLSSGMAEVIKCGVIGDEEILRHLETAAKPDLPWLVERCCRYKAAVVARDERDGGDRRLLNFGHTFGHAYEAAGGYDSYTHGEAVAAGMMQMLRWQVYTAAFGGVVLLLTVLFQATGKIVPSFLLSISRQGVVFLLALVVCVHLFQYQGVLMAQAVADILSAALALGLLAASRDIIAKQ